VLRDEPENGEKETGKSRFPVFVSPGQGGRVNAQAGVTFNAVARL
jgi:hypothetical protein